MSSGKLLTHHRRGYGVDVEALRDRFPLRQSAEKGPKMGSHEYRRLRRWKSGSVAPWMFRGYKSIYIGKIIRSGELRGAHKVGGAPHPPRRALHLCGRLEAPLTCTPSLLGGPRKIMAKVLFCLVFLFCETLKQ